MSDAFVGEIRLFGGRRPPSGWAICDGSILSISAYSVLYTLIGTAYGGDGQSTFALPDLRGRVPVCQGPGFTLAQKAGTETVTLTQSQLPSHSHGLQATSVAGDNADPTNRVWGQAISKTYSTLAPDGAFDASALAPAGNSQPHDNMLPYLAMNYIIALNGIFPSQS